MTSTHTGISGWDRSVVYASLALLFFTIPHTLEDFATGQPSEKGIPVAALAFVISILIAVQGLGLFWIGQRRRSGLFIHTGIGLFWPIASGMAQLPTILSGSPYRSGAISIIYVGGMIVVGIVLFVCSIIAVRADP